MRTADWSGVVNFHCMQLSLELSMMLFSATTDLMRHVHHHHLYTRTQSVQKQIVEYDIKSKYPREYLNFNKVGRDKLSARKSCFV